MPFGKAFDDSQGVAQGGSQGFDSPCNYSQGPHPLIHPLIHPFRDLLSPFENSELLWINVGTG